MPLPLGYAIAVIAFRAGTTAWRGYKAYQTYLDAKELAQFASDFKKAQAEIRKQFKQVIEALKNDIDAKSSTFVEIGKGGQSTVKRQGDGAGDYREYIARPIPFRPIISMVCETARVSPIQVPRKIQKKLPLSAENKIDVFLKQTTASLMFEVIDSMLEWKSPLKAEPNYSKKSKKAYLGDPPTKPKRFSEWYPFYPKPAGSLAPDLVIVEYRQKPFEIDNVFAAVEIKFPGDAVRPDQLDDYSSLMTPVGGRVAQGQKKVSLLRVPEDCTDLTKSKPAATPTEGGAKPAPNKRRGK